MAGIDNTQSTEKKQEQMALPSFNIPSFATPSFPQAQSNLNMNLDNLSASEAGGLLDKQNTQNGYMALASGVASFANNLMTALLSSQAIDAQAEIFGKQIELETAKVSANRDIALKALSVEDNKTFKTVEMHSNQIQHEEQMAKITGNFSLQLERVKQDAMTNRAKLLAATGDPFARKQPFYGNAA